MFYVLYSKHMFKYIFRLEVQGLNRSDFFPHPHECWASTGGKERRTRARKCGNDSKGRTIKIDFPKQTNCLMYNSDISPVTQRRVWSATNHRKWQSGLRWYNKQVQITLMNIRERGAAGGGWWSGAVDSQGERFIWMSKINQIFIKSFLHFVKHKRRVEP